MKDRARTMDSTFKSTLTVPGSNPFANSWDAISGKQDYGRPPPGSLTEARGIKGRKKVIINVNI